MYEVDELDELYQFDEVSDVDELYEVYGFYQVYKLNELYEFYKTLTQEIIALYLLYYDGINKGKAR